ncbi:MAG: hypothetical protein PVI70_12480 [Gammaproteobacteria bacterium]|jgi:hypothetical protein
MGVATTNPAARIEPGATLLPAAIEEIGPIDERPANRDSLAENFNREIDAWARHALGANGFGDSL